MKAPPIENNVVVGPFQCNCRIIVCPVTGKAAIIDPGDEAGKILKNLHAMKLPSGVPIEVTHLFHTHAHLDHIGGTRETREALPQSLIWLHKGDQEIYGNLKKQGEMFGFNYGDPLPVEKYFEDGEIIKVGELSFQIKHTPGHSPGSVSLVLDDSVYTGDTLFQLSVGRTDLWGGDFAVLKKSIRERLYTLDSDTRVCPGHGPDSKIGIEMRKNPFVTV